MYRTTLFIGSAALLLALAPGPAAASERFVQATGLEHASERLEAACAVATSPACQEELATAARAGASRLVELAKNRPELAAPLAVRAADAGAPALRAAAAEALAQPYATASATPILLELLDDPVPAVRAAALRALRGSNDESVRPFVRRAEASDPGGKAALAPDTTPAAPKLGVALPADAVYLHFASDNAEGLSTWSTAQAPAAFAAALARKGRGPFTPVQFKQEIEKMKASSEAEVEAMDPGDGMPTADQMAKMMAMAEKAMAAMEQNPNASPEQQAAAVAQAMGGSALDADLADDYAEAELFGDPKLFIVKGADGVEVAVAVYADRSLGRTGISVHGGPRLGR